MTVCNIRSRCMKPGRRHQFSDNVTLLADYNSKKIRHIHHTRDPHHVDKHNVIKTLSITFGRWLDNNQLKKLPSGIFSDNTKLRSL